MREGYAAGGTWAALPQKAVDIGTGPGDEGTATGSVYLIDPSDYSVKQQLTAADGSTVWATMAGAPVEPLRIAVDPLGAPWVSDVYGHLHSYSGEEWTW